MSLRQRLVLSTLVAVAIGLFVIAALVGGDNPGDISVTGNDAIDELIPARGSESVLSTDNVGIDLAPGYEGQLSINGIDIPIQQLNRVVALNQYLFRPGEGSAIERLDPQSNCASVTYWLSIRPDEQSEITWCFSVL